jgi:hypothetical protein
MMSGFLIWSALGMGFAGSFHCMGMCGPLALSITMPGKAGQSQFAAAGYFLGKTFTYGLLGLVFGFFGQQLRLAGMQQALSVTMGISMLLFVFLTIAKPSLFHQNKFTNWVNSRLTPIFSYLFKQRQGAITPVVFGMLNGLLPCGLVYFGLTAAIATGNAYQSSLFMLLFGLGTMPVMFAFLFLSRQFGYRFRLFFLRSTPYVMALLGVVLVLRGLDLGIPYVSPVLESLSLAPDRHTEVLGCHP